MTEVEKEKGNTTGLGEKPVVKTNAPKASKPAGKKKAPQKKPPIPPRPPDDHGPGPAVDKTPTKNDGNAFITVVVKKRLLTLNPNYVKKPYQFAVPTSASKRRPATGQEDILSDKQMTGEEKLRPEQIEELQMGPSPYIINPDVIYPIINAREFDLSYRKYNDGKIVYTNARDHAEWDCFTQKMEAGGSEVVAQDRKSYKIKDHAFFVEDKEKDAIDELVELDQEYEANEFVRKELGSGRFKDVLNLLSFEVPKYEVNPDTLTDTRIRQLVFKACKEHPGVVLQLKGDEAQKTVFILNLIKHKIITRKNGRELSYGGISLGASIKAVKDFMDNPTNGQIVTKWDNLLLQYEGK